MLIIIVTFGDRGARIKFYSEFKPNRVEVTLNASKYVLMYS